MSKNFELLQQIGNEEELFRTARQSTGVVPAENAEPSPELDKEARQRILQNASLPDVFQTTSATPGPILALCSELTYDLNEEVASTSSQKAPSAGEFRNSRNPTGPIGEPRKHAETRVNQSNTKSNALSRVISADGKSKAPSAPTSREATPRVEKETPRRSVRRSSLLLPWVDGIKTAAGRWGRKLHARNNHAGVDVEVLAREEGMKLVQRVFPRTDHSSPRAVLFSKLDGEAGHASTCARVGEILAARGEGRVCVVDANFRAPSLHEYFGAENVNGLTEATIEAGPIENFARQTLEPDLWLMPGGKAAAKLRFPAMADGLRLRMEELRNIFRYVVIHSGPLQLETSSMLLSRWADGVVLVLEANSTPRDTARRAKENLAAAGVSVLGVVLNNRTFPIPEVIYRRL
jgi:Mrp family chromosome partitioning ATPase